MRAYANANRLADQIGVQLVVKNAEESAGKLPLLSIAANEDREASVALGVDRLALLSSSKHQNFPKCFMQHVPTYLKEKACLSRSRPIRTIKRRERRGVCTRASDYGKLAG